MRQIINGKQGTSDGGAGVDAAPSGKVAAREEEERRSLFGMGGQRDAKQAGPDARKQQIESTKDTMSENMEKLHERGQKVSQIAEASEELAQASGSFAAAARKLREKQEKKGWFGF